MIDLVQTIWPSATQAYLIVVVLLLYAAFIVVFGFRYYRLYRAEPDLFFVQSEIEKKHASRLLQTVETRLERVRTEIEILGEFEAALASGPVDRIPATVPDGRLTALLVLVTVGAYIVAAYVSTNVSIRLLLTFPLAGLGTMILFAGGALLYGFFSSEKSPAPVRRPGANEHQNGCSNAEGTTARIRRRIASRRSGLRSVSPGDQSASSML